MKSAVSTSSQVHPVPRSTLIQTTSEQPRYTIEDVSLGSHKITISKTGYIDYTKWVTVKADSTVSVSADLNADATAGYHTGPTVATTKTPLKVTTVKVPTSWPTR